jgi:hypothetical protein
LINNLVFEGLIDYNEDLRFRDDSQILENLKRFFYQQMPHPFDRKGRRGRDHRASQKGKKRILPADVCRQDLWRNSEITPLPPGTVVTQEKEGGNMVKDMTGNAPPGLSWFCDQFLFHFLRSSVSAILAPSTAEICADIPEVD